MALAWVYHAVSPLQNFQLMIEAGRNNGVRTHWTAMESTLTAADHGLQINACTPNLKFCDSNPSGNSINPAPCNQNEPADAFIIWEFKCVIMVLTLRAFKEMHEQFCCLRSSMCNVHSVAYRHCCGTYIVWALFVWLFGWSKITKYI